MFKEKTILAIVPARSGSKGIIDKNMQKIQGQSLIAHAGSCLSQLPWIDQCLISTDSESYAREGMQFGLSCPFLRPQQLSSDKASAVDTMQQVLQACESHYQTHYDIILLIEPTSPLRSPEDIQNCVSQLVQHELDSVISVSPINIKHHPYKLLVTEQGYIKHYHDQGQHIVARQQLTGQYYIRNGVCYALTRDCLCEKNSIFTERSQAYIIERPLANIDEPLDLLWAEFLLQQRVSQKR